MNFPDHLSAVLDNDAEGSFNHAGLVKWNEEIESFLSDPSRSGLRFSSQETKGGEFKEMIEKVSCVLHSEFLDAIHKVESRSEDPSEVELEEMARAVKANYLEANEDVNLQKLFDTIRASKNLLRWYIQIFLEQEGRVVPSPIRRLQSPAIIELLVTILMQNNNDVTETHRDLCRNISLYLFYATYSPFRDDQLSQKVLAHLMSDLKYTEVVLRLLTQPCTAALALSLVRGIHNAIVSMQGASRIVNTTKLAWDPVYSKVAPWAPKVRCFVTFQSTCVDAIRWAFQTEPSFPGDDEDKRSELVTEILGAFYALRAGQKLDSSRGDPSLLQVVVDSLRLSQKDNRILQCKLATISLLMDADPTFGSYLIEHEALTPLLDILEIQTTDVLENTRVDHSATAALVPILVVLNKFACANNNFRRYVKCFVFPEDAEDVFQERVRSQRLSRGSKNMAPLDAPKGTLRWKLASLLTWMESHIKRCTAELLWTLSSSDPTEYVYRVGLGNAFPLLSAKGFAQMPSQS